MVALTSVSDMFFGLFIHRSGVARLLKIFSMSESIKAQSVILSISLSSLFMPIVLGVRVILNTIGVVLVSDCVCLLFCLVIIFSIRLFLFAGVKYCCMSVVLCARSHSWQQKFWACLWYSVSSEQINLTLLTYSCIHLWFSWNEVGGIKRNLLCGFWQNGLQFTCDTKVLVFIYCYV